MSKPDWDYVSAWIEKAEAFWSESFIRFREDLRFTNPSNPEQWDDGALAARKNPKGPRPCEVFDFTNQNIMQVSNDFRNNKVAPHLLPVEGTTKKSAETMEGLLRYIDYRSRTQIADETALELAARCGLGFTMVSTEVIDPETNKQEIRVQRIADTMSVLMDPNSTEPDGSDMMRCAIKVRVGRDEFEEDHPDIDTAPSPDCESDNEEVEIIHFYYIEKKKEKLAKRDENGKIIDGAEKASRKVCMQKWAGGTLIEEYVIPGVYIPVVPTIGYDLIIEGKRYICGIGRRLRSSQISYNYSRNAELEITMASPKAPWLIGRRAVDGFEDDWDNANNGNPSRLTFNDIDAETGQPIAPPTRIAPPFLSQAFSELSQVALKDGERAIGMFAANLGAASNETSGKAINARARQGAIGNYHYMDGAARAIEHRTRIIIGMIPTIYDEERQQIVLSENGGTNEVTINPEMPAAYHKENDRVYFNPSHGVYGVRVKVGPGFATMRQEASEMLTEVMRTSPAAAAAVLPIWAENQDWQGAEQVKKAMMAIAPPQVQAALSEDTDLPPEAMAAIQSAQGQAKMATEQAQAAMQEMGEKLKELEEALQIARIQAHNREAEAAAKIAAVNVDQEQIALDREKAMIDAELRAAELSLQDRKQSQEAASEAARIAIDAMTAKQSAAPPAPDMTPAIQELTERVASAEAAALAPKQIEVIFDETGMPVGGRVFTETPKETELED